MEEQKVKQNMKIYWFSGIVFIMLALFMILYMNFYPCGDIPCSEAGGYMASLYTCILAGVMILGMLFAGVKEYEE